MIRSATVLILLNVCFTAKRLGHEGSGWQDQAVRSCKTVATWQLMTRSDKPISHATFHGPAKPFSTSLIHDFQHCKLLLQDLG